MQEIQILSSAVIDQIAAGEVVERPAQLVKELVENSLDAFAKNITVEFSEGGRFVKVVDDGVGILPDQLAKALDRHATSKIRKSEDLWSLHSFGFRGEALASISAVSKLSLISKTQQQSKAAKIISEFGKREFIAEIGGETGTTVQVEKLFENVPARLKFLKSSSAESTQIKNVLKALALSHPQVSFRVLSDAEIIFIWPACEDRKKRVSQILEIENLYVGEAVRENVKAYSVFADPNTTAKTSKNMWFFAQNRWVQDRSIQAAVQEAYRNLLMHGEYPICVTWVETEPDKIDVNIHPTKSQVKFLEPSLVFRAVQASVRDTLEKAPWLSKMPLEKNQGPADVFKPSNLEFNAADFKKTVYQQKPTLLDFQNEAAKREQYFQDIKAEKASAAEVSSSGLFAEPSETISREPQFEGGGLRSEGDRPQSEAGPQWQSLQVLAQADLTYILTQSRSGLMIVDQHAAHERVLFEKMMKAWKMGGLDIQDFLFPLAFDLPLDQVEALLREKNSFEKLGLVLEQMGPGTVGVNAAPAVIKESSLPGILESASVAILEQGGSFAFENYVSHLCATMACHSAIRAGQALSMDEMKALLVAMDEFPLSSFCPHGRPVFVEYSFAKLEKDFGRVSS